MTIIYYCGQESLRRNEVYSISSKEQKNSQQKSPKCSTWRQSQKRQNNLYSFPRQTIQYYRNPRLCLTSKAEEAEWFYEDLQDLLELTPPKNVLFIIGDWNAKVGSPEIPGVTGKFGLGVQNKAGQRPIQFCQENALVIANTLFQQHKKRLYTWTSPEGQYQNQMIIFFAAKDGEALYNQQKQDWELTLAQLMKSILPNLDLN